MATGNLTLDPEEARIVRHALLIGLDCYGEVDSLRDAFELKRMAGQQFDENLCPPHPTGSSDTVSLFAHALRLTEPHIPAD